MTELKPKQQRRIETAAAAAKILGPLEGQQSVFDMIQLANYVENGWETISDDETEEMDDHPGDAAEAPEDGTADRGTYKCAFCGQAHPIKDQTGGTPFVQANAEELAKALGAGDFGRLSTTPFPGAHQIPVEPGSPLDKELRKALADDQALNDRDPGRDA